MRTFLKVSLVLVIISAVSVFASSSGSETKFVPSQNVNLTVKITGFDELEGKALIALWNNGENFPDKDGKVYKSATLNANAYVLKYTFNVPVGTYAIALFHDADSDGELSTNFLGIPTEGYGFSNNVSPTFSAPSFDEAKFNLQKDTEIEIKLIYLL
jgi:uncharacterized protein (DUF2141 family)